MDLPLDPTLVQPGDRLLVGVSGGSDSLALLHALVCGRERLGIQLTAVHVHHGMRGAEADADAGFLADLCDLWGVPLRVVRTDVPVLAAERRISVEAAGREARYQVFRAVAEELGCNKVATAHTADDQVETILLHLLRGAGPDGLAGMPASRPLDFQSAEILLVRPLLGARRVDTEEYCLQQGLLPRQDPTNRDLRYRRNRIRHELLPLLEAMAPGVRAHLLSLGVLAAGDREYLAAESDRLREAARCPSRAGFTPADLTLSAPLLQAAPTALARRAIRSTLTELGVPDPAFRWVEAIRGLVVGEAPGPLNLPGGRWRVTRTGLELRFYAVSPAPPPSPDPVPIATPGVTEAPSFQLILEVRETVCPPELRLPLDQAVLDRAALRGPLRLRCPKRGDRLQPLGAPGRQLVSDLFASRRVSRETRSTWPLLVDDAGIVWVVGLAIEHRVRVQAGSAECLALHSRPLVVSRAGSRRATPE